LFARVIDIRPDIVILLREVGFVYLSFNVLFFLAEKPKVKKAKIKKAVKKRFFLNASSALNFFPIPYYVLLV
jgi:hypothetical protein